MVVISPAEYETRIHALEKLNATLAAEIDRQHVDGRDLYGALENIVGDLFLLGLAEIKLEDIQAGSASDAMKVLKRLQTFRVKDVTLAIGQQPKAKINHAQ